MNQAQIRSPWEYCKGVLALAPVASNAAQNGAAVDRSGYRSAILDVAYSCTGAPTGGTITAKIQDSDDGATWADLVSNGAAVTASAAIVAAGGVLSVNVHLGGARKFVRSVTTGAPTGGNTPVVSAAATLRLHGPDNLPAL